MEFFGLQADIAGIQVNRDTAMQVPAFRACVRVLADSLGALPLELYRQRDDSHELAMDHSLYRLLRQRPQPALSSFAWRRLIVQDVLAEGRHVSVIERRRGDVRAIWPVHPSRLRVERRPAGDQVYWVGLSNGPKVGRVEADVLHLRDLDQDGGLSGRATLSDLRRTIGLALAVDMFWERYFLNGTRPGIVVKHPGKVGKQAIENVKASLTQGFAGLENAFKVMVLEEGADVTTLKVTLEEAQLVEGRRLLTEEIARGCGVPPIFIQDLERATFANGAQQDLHFVKYSLRPWIVMLTQELDEKVAPSGHFTRIPTDDLVKADFNTRMEGYARAIQSGVMTPNEARAKEGLPPLPGGDVLMIQGATVPLTAAGEEPPMTLATEGGDNAET